MVQFSYSEFTVFLFMTPIACFAGLFIILKAKNLIEYLIYRIESNKMFKERYKAVEEMKAKGELHEWINIAVALNHETHVCKKTGYCPELHGFLDLDYIANIVKMRQEQKEYEDYKVEKLNEIATDFGIKFDEMDDIVNRIFSLKKDFYTKKLNDLQKELEQKNDKV